MRPAMCRPYSKGGTQAIDHSQLIFVRPLAPGSGGQPGRRGNKYVAEPR